MQMIFKWAVLVWDPIWLQQICPKSNITDKMVDNVKENRISYYIKDVCWTIDEVCLWVLFLLFPLISCTINTRDRITFQIQHLKWLTYFGIETTGTFLVLYSQSYSQPCTVTQARNGLSVNTEKDETKLDLLILNSS